jgi:hypothetical protein
VGIFASQSNLFRRYRARLLFRDKVMGGTPKDPKLIEGWLRAKAGITDVDEVRVALIRTLAEQGADVRPDMTYEEVEAAAEKIAGTKETTGFKRGEHGLYLEARQIKAAIKEATNILYAGERVGPTKKGAKSYLAERVFVAPDQIWLGRMEPDGIEMIVGHVSGPQGPRSTLGYHEYVQRPDITFDVLVTRDSIPPDWWPELWTQMEENAIGALRSQGYGKFDILAWDVVEPTSSVVEPRINASRLGELYADALTA